MPTAMSRGAAPYVVGTQQSTGCHRVLVATRSMQSHAHSPSPQELLAPCRASWPQTPYQQLLSQPYIQAQASLPGSAAPHAELLTSASAHHRAAHLHCVSHVVCLHTTMLTAGPTSHTSASAARHHDTNAACPSSQQSPASQLLSATSQLLPAASQLLSAPSNADSAAASASSCMWRSRSSRSLRALSSATAAWTSGSWLVRPCASLSWRTAAACSSTAVAAAATSASVGGSSTCGASQAPPLTWTSVPSSSSYLSNTAAWPILSPPKSRMLKRVTSLILNFLPATLTLQPSYPVITPALVAAALSSRAWRSFCTSGSSNALLREGMPMRVSQSVSHSSSAALLAYVNTGSVTPSRNRSCDSSTKFALNKASGSCSRSTPSTRYFFVAWKYDVANANSKPRTSGSRYCSGEARSLPGCATEALASSASCFFFINPAKALTPFLLPPFLSPPLPLAASTSSGARLLDPRGESIL
mmetsp:Transcript_21015/g.46103  ORF Transcript_21015/g.46103 Transcript_21015/m.46103 type:complete len:473 (+) Transcript_21015:1277-2695(+)